MNHLGHEGLVKRVVGGHWGLVPKLQRLAVEGKSRPTTCPRASSATCTAILPPTSRAPSPMSDWAPLSIRATAAEGSNRGPRETWWNPSLRRSEVPGLPDLSDQYGDVAGNHSRHRRQYHHGKGGPDPRALAIATAARNSGGFVIVQVERIAGRHPQCTAGQDSGHHGRLRGAGTAGATLADLCRALQPGIQQ